MESSALTDIPLLIPIFGTALRHPPEALEGVVCLSVPPSFFQPRRPSLLQSSFIALLSFAFLSRFFQPNPILCCWSVGRSAGRSAGWGKRESKDRECVRQESFSSSRMYSQDGSIETTSLSLPLSLTHTLRPKGPEE